MPPVPVPSSAAVPVPPVVAVPPPLAAVASTAATSAATAGAFSSPGASPGASVVPPGTLAPGTRLGRYEVIAELGTGGMATVYFGRALAVGGFQRLVAIKYLHPHLLKDQDFVQMFLDEGRLAARIHHPNVVATLDLEHTPQGIYIVSEYIEGDQLLGLYKTARGMQKRIPFPVTMRIAMDVLAGLHAAHELTDDVGAPLKIVHRDVSPQNILVGTDGIARITDFGIAKAEERISNTRDGIVKGKLSYMAPEQPNDEPVDRRADVFSAATVIWECLTGRRLFPGKTDGEVLKNLLHNPIPRLRDVDPELPEAVDAVLARALSRKVSDRYANAGAFADALESAAAAASFAVATSRPVATYVREIAGPKIATELRMRRALPTREIPVYRPPATPSQIRPIPMPSTEEAPATVRYALVDLHPTEPDAPSSAAPSTQPVAPSVAPSVGPSEPVPAAMDLPTGARSSLPPRMPSDPPPSTASAATGVRSQTTIAEGARPASGGAITTLLTAVPLAPRSRTTQLFLLIVAIIGLGFAIGGLAWVWMKPSPLRTAGVPSPEPGIGVLVPTVTPVMTPSATTAPRPAPLLLPPPPVTPPVPVFHPPTAPAVPAAPAPAPTATVVHTVPPVPAPAPTATVVHTVPPVPAHPPVVHATPPASPVVRAAPVVSAVPRASQRDPSPRAAPVPHPSPRIHAAPSSDHAGGLPTTI